MKPGKMRLVVLCAVLLCCTGGPRAESVFDVLVERASDVAGQGEGLSPVEIKKRLTDLQRILEGVRKQREKKILEQRLRALKQIERRFLASLAKLGPKGGVLGQWMGRGAKEAREGAKVILQIQAAYESLEQSLTALREAYTARLRMLASLDKVLIKQFPAGHLETGGRLVRALKRIEVRCAKWIKERDDSVRQLRQINLQIQSQEQALLQARKVILSVRVAPIKRVLPRHVQAPRQVARSLPKPASRPLPGPTTRSKARPQPHKNLPLRPRPSPPVRPALRSRVVPTRPTLPPARQPLARRGVPVRPTPRAASRRVVRLQRAHQAILLRRRLDEARASVQRIQFSRVRRQLRLLLLQKRDEERQIQTARQYVWLYTHTQKQLTNRHRLQAAKSEGGLLHFAPFSWKPVVLTSAVLRFHEVAKGGPSATLAWATTRYSRFKVERAKQGWWGVFWELLIPLLLLGFGWYIRRHLVALVALCMRNAAAAEAGMLAQQAAVESAQAAEEVRLVLETAALERGEEPLLTDEATRRPMEELPEEGLDEAESHAVEERSFAAAFHTWRSLGLVGSVMRDALWYGVVCLLLLIVLPTVQLPDAWDGVLLFTLLLVMTLRGVWTLANHIFAHAPEDRFWQSLDDDHARKFRHVAKWIACLTLLTLPVLQVLQVLKFPEPFHDALVLLLLVFLLGVLWVAFFNGRKFLEILTYQTSTGGLGGFVLFRLYPGLLLCSAGFLGVYAWGYRNLAGYLLQGMLASVLWILLGVTLFNALTTLSLRLFGRSQDEEAGLIPIEQRLRTQALRSARFVLGGLLTLLVFGLLLMSWRVPGGFGAIFKLLNYPFVSIQKSRISLISIIKFVMVFGAAVWFSRFVKRQLQRYAYPLLRMESGSQHATNTVLGYMILAVGGLLGLQVMGMGIGVLTIFAGVVGIGIGFGSQNIVNNFISGLLITFGRPISVGDLIEIDSVSGTVQEISARCTTILTPDARLILIPNSEIISKKVINWSLGPPYVKVSMVLGVAYDTDVKQVETLLLAEAAAHKEVLIDPQAVVRFKEFGPSAMEISLTIAVAEPSSRNRILSELRFLLDQKLRALGIEVAAPRRTLLLETPIEVAVLDMNASAGEGKEAPS